MIALKALSLAVQHEEFVCVYMHLRTHTVLADVELELCKTAKLPVNICINYLVSKSGLKAD